MFNIGIFPWFMIAATALFFFLPAYDFKFKKQKKAKSTYTSKQFITITVIFIYLAIQILVPFRHFLYPGNVSWTEEGHRFSWHMKLRTKSSYGTFYAVDPTKDLVMEIDPDDFLTSRQRNKMPKRPDMVLQFAHYIKGVLEKDGFNNVEVYAEIMTSLNGHKDRLMINPTVDLAAQPRNLKHASWIMPYETSLKDYESPFELDAIYYEP